MHDVSSIITALGSFLGGLVIAYNAWGKHRTDSVKQIIKNLNDEIGRLKQDSNVYRKRWLDAEKGNKDKDKVIEAKDKEICRLRKLNNKLSKDLGEFK